MNISHIEKALLLQRQLDAAINAVNECERKHKAALTVQRQVIADLKSLGVDG